MHSKGGGALTWILTHVRQQHPTAQALKGSISLTHHSSQFLELSTSSSASSQLPIRQPIHQVPNSRSLLSLAYKATALSFSVIIEWHAASRP